MGSDLSFRTGGMRFNVRTAAIIKHDGHILCDEERGTNFSFLPGGRIKRGENSATALRRELAEELEIDVYVERPLIIAESFYDGVDERYHEMAFYYVVQKPASLAFSAGEVCHSHTENGSVYDFTWVKATPEELLRVRLEPIACHSHFIDLPAQSIHAIIQE